MKRTIWILIGISSLLSCKKENITKSIPACIQEKIDAFEEEAAVNPPAKLYRYQYNGQTVYYVPPRCCDIWSTVYDEECTIICHADGGITGGGDGRCIDFLTARTDEELIWEDD